MRLNEFIESLDSAGWQGTSDAQHKRIAELHKKLFPVVSKLEDEIEDLNKDLINAMKKLTG